MSYESHKFFCTHCGKEGLNIYRNKASQRGKGHLKKLWCIHCKDEVNHYECYSQQDVEKFKRKFENGDFKNDNIESNVRSSSIRQIQLY